MLTSFRFSVKALLVVVTLVAIGAGTFGVRLERAHRQREAVAQLVAAQVSVMYDYQSGLMGGLAFDPFADTLQPTRFNSPGNTEISPWKRWLGRRFGRDFVADIQQVFASRPLSADLVQRLGDIRSIESLHLQVGEEFSDEAWQALLKCRNVERLRLDRYPFNPTRRLAGLSAMKQLRSLTIGAGEFSVADAQEVAGLINLRQLTLNLVGTTDDALAPLAGLRGLENFELTHRGQGREVTNSGVAFLADLPKLRVLTLARLPRIDDDVCAHLAKMPQLESLNLDQATIRGASFDRLAGLAELITLNLIGTQIDDAAVEKLSRLQQLEALDVGGTRITDAGMKHLAVLHNLRRLSLYSNRLSDEGIARLAELKQLEELALTGTAVTDAGLTHLAGLTKLRTLYLGSEAKVSAQAVAALKKALPECSIYQH